MIAFIAKHLNESNLKLTVHNVDSICSFTGEKISRGVANKDLIKKSFTDHDYIRYSGDYSSVDAALCIQEVIQTDKGFNALRNYSYLVTEHDLILLRRDEILSVIFNPPIGKFILVVTYSNKKHTSYKAKLNCNQEIFIVTTDAGDVVVNRDDVLRLLPILSSWYCIVNGKEETSAKPTYFTKAQILGVSEPKRSQILEYGIGKYFEESRLLDQYRGTQLLKLLVHVLNKTNESKV